MHIGGGETYTRARCDHRVIEMLIMKNSKKLVGKYILRRLIFIANISDILFPGSVFEDFMLT